jgi:hypothetical protein
MDKAHAEAIASKHAALHAIIDAEEHRPHRTGPADAIEERKA